MYHLPHTRIADKSKRVSALHLFQNKAFSVVDDTDHDGLADRVSQFPHDVQRVLHEIVFVNTAVRHGKQLAAEREFQRPLVSVDLTETQQRVHNSKHTVLGISKGLCKLAESKTPGMMNEIFENHQSPFKIRNLPVRPSVPIAVAVSIAHGLVPSADWCSIFRTILFPYYFVKIKVKIRRSLQTPIISA